jgi:MoaE-MoaD fusion protein
MIQITVLFFATLRERTGQKKIQVELTEGSSLADLKLYLSEKYPEAKILLDRALSAIDHEYAFDHDVLTNGMEVAFFPPVSGGSDDDQQNLPTWCAITLGPLDLNELTQRVKLPTTGAVCLFTGIVRQVTAREEAHQTEYLEYEAYIPMAEAKMHQVAREIRERWIEVQGIAIIQRIGHLDPGTPTVVIACSAAHRDCGIFEAARYGIDRLKEIVPIWKKEVSPEGETWVEGHYHPGPADQEIR